MSPVVLPISGCGVNTFFLLGSAAVSRRSWWLHTSAGLPGGPVWLWASPRSGVIWPWSTALLAVRGLVRRVWWWALPRLIRRRSLWRAWWRSAPRWAHTLRLTLSLVLCNLLGPVVCGLIGLWLLRLLHAWVGEQGLFIFDLVGGNLF